ncbi:hypothetical protein PR003_g387 [Phytophthora rubi]|uniref:Reverse transcriptase Ty1/copia-type domain-containing protein n=1 Tax=Phytophthora rubi TaxID=129364 RepID=A0A6A4G761_9STRA|nr:hypothetical protein PR003_g387 [Phytophthora rubi]
MNLDWWGLPKFTDKKLYAGMGADWGKTLVQRLSRADDERRGLAARLQDSCLQWQVGRSGVGLIREDAASLGFRVKRDGPHGGPDARVLHYEDAGNQGDGAGVGAEGPGKSPSITRCEQDYQTEGGLLPRDGIGIAPQPTVRMFQLMMGCLLWIARCTRPGIAFAVHREPRRSHTPRQSDWRLAKSIARYLEGTIDYRFAMQTVPDLVDAAEVVLEAFSDADYAGDRVDRKSVSGGSGARWSVGSARSRLVPPLDDGD